jgi:pimeloyl-ACP methyl ester carboxylesterase
MNVTVDGLPVHAERRPGRTDWPEILFLHGAGMDSGIWHDAAAQLSERGYGTVRVDFPGHGGSGGAALDDIEEIGRWTASLVAALGLERPALAGHSMGAAVALNAAAAMGKSLSAVILCAISDRLAVHPDLLALARDDRKQAEALIAKWGFAAPGASLEDAFAEQADGVLATDLAACDSYTDGPADAARIACPALYLLGAEDKMTPPAKAAALIAATPNAAKRELAGCGHMMQLEAPETVAETIDGFLKQLP